MRRALFVLVGCAVLAGCGGSTHDGSTTSPTTTSSTQTIPSAAAHLEQAVKEAINQDHAISVRALWTNTVPGNHPATAGPQLTALRQSVAQRRAQGLRVKLLKEQFRIVAVRLAPSYSAASATVTDHERVQPSYANGRPRGKAVTLSERVRLELRRVGDAHFVVWKVTASS
jgi:hypothetical protein